MAVKDKQSSKVIGYCVNYDSDRLINGKNVVVKDEDKPISLATVTEDFTKMVCGKNFYKKYKG
ncbi:hypothetical protein [Providencia sp. PROV129]|uniref:hypothetical protein n=1 Tax=Providencia sp. PROV129 TaxID=2949839 RepID=UPI00234BB0CB|nr:hypothetical protein [Providencia sp. PROV129]